MAAAGGPPKHGGHLAAQSRVRAVSLNITVPERTVWCVQPFISSSDRCALSQSTAARKRVMKPVRLSRCIGIGVLSRCSSMLPVHVVLMYSTVTDARLMNGLSAG